MAGSLVEESYDGITVPSGDPEGLTGAAAKWSASAGSLERLAGRVDAMPAALSSWRGPASVAFGGATLMAAGAARAGVQAFDTAALTARAYAAELSDAQDLARQAIKEAIVANGRIRKAQAQIKAAQEREAAAELAAAWAQVRIDATDATGLPLFSGARGDKAAAEGRAEDARADQRRWRKELTEARTALQAAQKKGRRAQTAARDAARAAGIAFSAAAGWVPEIPTLGAPANVSGAEAEAITFVVDLRFARAATAASGPARYQPPDVPDGLIGVPRSPEQRAREAPPLDPSTADQSMLSTIGLIPILGIPADIAGAIYSAAQRDKTGVGLSLAGIAFEGGDAAKLGRLGTNLAKEGEAATDTARAAKVPPYAGGKTKGVFEGDGQQTGIISGREGPASGVPRGTPGFDAYVRTHVEGHAAALMRKQGIDRASLYINQVPCPNCDRNLPRALPEGAELTVFGPNGYEKTYRGTP